MTTVETNPLLLKIAKSIASKAKCDALYRDEDAGNIYKLAVKNGVVGLLCKNNTKGSLSAQSPLFTQLSFYQQQYEVINSFVNQETLHFLQCLKQANIHVVVLKGFALAHQIYETTSLRPKTDIDILIDGKDEQALHRLFLENGYINPRGWQPKAISHEFSYKKSLGKNLVVLFDVHLKISNNPLIENLLSFSHLLQVSNQATLANIQLIDTKNAFIHAVLHLLHHRVFGDPIKLIWYYDIYLLVKGFSSDEREALFNTIKEKAMSQLFIEALTLTEQYFPCSQLKHFRYTLQPLTYDEKYNFLLTPTHNAARIWLQITSDKPVKQKFAYLKETIFPPAEEVYLKYGQVNKLLLPYYYAKRMLFGIIKFFKR